MRLDYVLNHIYNQPCQQGKVVVEFCWLKVRSSLMVVNVLFIDLNVLASVHGMPVPVAAVARRLVPSPSPYFSSMSGDLF